jgi:hypothetical protein
MIIWLASYPKSGNTLIRSMLTAYLFSQDGNFNFDLLNNIKQFPDNAVFTKLGIDISDEKEVVKNYIFAQEEINKRDGKSVRFLKTHSGLNNINGYSFTNYKNTLGAIYIARDPRKVLKSYANHSEITFEEAQKRILNFGIVGGKSDPINQTVIHSGSWASNYNSWKEFKKKNKYLLVKYEDLISDPEKCFTSVLKFTYKISNSSLKIDKNKLGNVLKTTTFEYLQNLEKKENFKEATSVTKKIDFFKYGPKNDGKKGIPKKIIENLEKNLNKEMKELGYL